MKFALAPLAAILLAACTVGPNYKRPQVGLPDQFRGAKASAAIPSLADQKWVDLFHDDTLTQLVTAALERNFDLRIAAERVIEARAQYGITNANRFPAADGQTTFTVASSSSVGSAKFLRAGTNLTSSYTNALATVSWDLDIWGRLRRLTEAARAQYLSTEEGRRAVVVSLVGDVMNAYFSLLEQDLELAIGNQTRALATDGLRLTRLRHDRGAVSALDVHQAEQLLYTATAQIAGVERNIGEAQDALSLLTGDAPHEIPRASKLEQLPPPPELPAGLPSDLLTRRPDIRQAEEQLIAQNAQIGAARALFFPDISLTAFFGGQSRALSNLFTGPAREYSVAPQALIPIFHKGLRSGLRLTEAEQREALINYQKTIYTALRDVSDALISHEQTRAQRLEEEKLVEALDASVKLATTRYRGGLDSYLQVLDAQRNLFEGQLALAQLRLQEVLSVVQFYRALGGGWQ
jgi:NodT family efflux transporter outer membrane factor (OMF) lipoprotein